jgi:hypothetical protein
MERLSSDMEQQVHREAKKIVYFERVSFIKWDEISSRLRVV